MNTEDVLLALINQIARPEGDSGPAWVANVHRDVTEPHPIIGLMMHRYHGPGKTRIEVKQVLLNGVVKTTGPDGKASGGTWVPADVAGRWSTRVPRMGDVILWPEAKG